MGSGIEGGLSEVYEDPVLISESATSWEGGGVGNPGSTWWLMGRSNYL